MIPFLSIKDLTYSYHTSSGETPALKSISFQAEKGEFIAIVGPSGCGKSTLLSLIAGLLTPEAGSITLYGMPLNRMKEQIGYMLQKDHLFEWRTVLGNVLLGLEIRKELNEKNRQNVLDMLETYGLSSFKNAKPSQLSGGMRQRAALIRTLALDPELLLLDEPFSALDYQTRLRVGDDIGNIIRKEEKTAILVTHDLAEAIRMADRILVLSSRPGKILKDLSLDFSCLEQDTPLARSDTEVFHEYFNLIWKELNDHEQPVITGTATVSNETETT
ncbi:MAG: ABC transporter ATP-binding protein [Lachnospiraceae bacterium]